MGKKYSVNMEDGQVVSVEVDGVAYAGPNEIPDEQDREQIERLIARLADNEASGSLGQEFEEEFHRMEKQSARSSRLFVGIFLGVGLIMLAIAAISSVGAVRTMAREVSAPGKVIELVVQRSQDSQTNEITDYTYPIVEFWTADEKHQVVQMSEGSSPPAYAVGDQVTILYDPQQPKNSRIQSFASNLLLWLLPGITGLLGVIFVAVALVVFKVWPSRKETAST